MPSLNLNFDYFGHHKTKRLIRLLGRGSEVLPLKLWIYTGKYFAETGRLTEISAKEIEEECQWWGEPGKMVQVMIDVGFIDLDGETYMVHDWMDHESHISAFSERAKLGAAAKWEKYRQENGNAPSNASSITSSNASSYALTLHNQTYKKKTKSHSPAKPAGISVQARVMDEIWKPKWSAAHFGASYSPGKVDYVKLAGILSRLRDGKDESHAIEQFKKIADIALLQPETFGWEGHKLTKVDTNLSALISEMMKREKGISNAAGRKPTTGIVENLQLHGD